MRNELKDILETVEQVRATQCPELDAEFVAAVVRAEEENPEDDGGALRSIESALRIILEREGLSDASS